MLRTALIAVLALVTAPAPSADGETDTDARIHFLAIGTLPLDGGFVAEGGVRSRSIFDESRKNEWERQLRSAWGIDAFPTEVEGVTWEGQPVHVRLSGVEPNEFGKLWRVTQRAGSDDDGPLIYWSGSLELKVRRPVKRALLPRDEKLIRARCVKAGFELKQPIIGLEAGGGGSGATYSMDDLGDEDRADIARPDVAANVRIDAVSPSGVAGIGLAGCRYASVASSDTWYRGPVFAYDFDAGRIAWSDALDLDEHLNFLEYAGDLYLVEYIYCDRCETGGWTVGRFANQVRTSPDPSTSAHRTFRLVDRHAESISGTSSWFDGD